MEQLTAQIEDLDIPSEATMSGASRLCEDCRWMRIRSGDAVEDALCGHPSSIWHQEPDLITGKAPPPATLSCHFARKKDWPLVSDTCGPEGKHWEPDPAPWLDRRTSRSHAESVASSAASMSNSRSRWLARQDPLPNMHAIDTDNAQR